MIRRNLLKALEKWAGKTNRKPMVIRGARQVGKTTLVKEFANSFRYFVALNLERPDDRKLFEVADSPERLLEIIRLTRENLPNDFSQQRVLIFIDEIQNEPKAISMLRYFYEDFPGLHVIAAGSRLQELFKSGVSFPVGRVEYLTLRPCFFDEFLSGIDKENLSELVAEGEFHPDLHPALTDLFHQYALVGGMPEVISDYSYHQQVSQLAPLYRGLLQSYDEDVEKYAVSRQQVDVLRHILRNGWEMAGQTITYNRFAGSSYSSTAVHESLELLERAFLLNLVYPATSVRMPPMAAYTRSPKLVWLDSGLVNFSAQIQVEYLTNRSLIDVWRGHAAEQVVGQSLWQPLDRQYAMNENYWIRDKRGSNAEVDFVFPYQGMLLPVEVKSGTNAHLRSLHSYLAQEGSPGIGIRIWPGEYSVEEVPNSITGKTHRLVNVPFYLIGALEKVLQRTV